MTTCSGLIQPLNLECWFVNVFSGSWAIFALISLIVILILGGKFRMPNAAIGGVLMLFGIMFFGQIPWFTYVSVLIGSIVIWSIIANIIKR